MKFASRGTEDIYDGVASRHARATLPVSLHSAGAERLDLVIRLRSLDTQRALPGYRFEELKGNRKGTYCIRINRQYRVTFSWTDGESADILIEDYH